MDKARRVDRLYCDTEPGEVGHIEAKLLSYERVRGLVLGAFGEASKPVHQLVDVLATSRVTVVVPQSRVKNNNWTPEPESRELYP